MHATAIYKALSDETRLRLLNLLSEGSLCVCHLQEILDQPQARVSKQLGYLKRQGLVDCEHRGTWHIYHLCEPRPALLQQNLDAMRHQPRESALFQADILRLRKLNLSGQNNPAACA